MRNQSYNQWTDYCSNNMYASLYSFCNNTEICFLFLYFVTTIFYDLIIIIFTYFLFKYHVYRNLKINVATRALFVNYKQLRSVVPPYVSFHAIFSYFFFFKLNAFSGLFAFLLMASTFEMLFCYYTHSQM